MDRSKARLSGQGMCPAAGRAGAAAPSAMPRRVLGRLLRRLLLAAPLAAPLATPAAAAWPERPVTLILPFAAGASPDITGRLVAERLSAAWGQPVVVQNVPGASATIGVDRVAKAAPDGYTIGYTGDGAMVVRVSMDPPIPYDPVRDLAPISLLFRTRNLLVVHPAVPARSLAEFIAHAKAQPGAMSYGHSGIGFSTHLGMEMLKQAAGIELVTTPYTNEGQMVADLISGRLQASLGSIVLLRRVQAGELRPLAVSSRDRLPALPEVPTIAESGFPGFEAVAWFGLVAPARTPPEILARIQRDTAAALAEPALRQRVEELGLVVVANTPDEFRAMVPQEIARMQAVLQPLGLRAR
ncbi:Bug family tripartite tricarboxylate transporter substrate binding protein [Siccirubricoccus phaeus]|uniref:Bug family tripartite tricarboxylate transporter substrate binding protein n=1 Tax=Siccirubricoccus phaeus TaxID=2595053 RepID=UPI0011F2FD9D|nr:tripartite tricarboxylate transporter substrate binding protein [Siccirubricoccus phaeus]